VPTDDLSKAKLVDARTLDNESNAVVTYDNVSYALKESNLHQKAKD